MEDYLYFFSRFFFIFAITLPFDVRDMKLDRLMGVRTLPNVLGVKITRVLSSLAIVAHLGIVSFLHFSDYYIDNQEFIGLLAAGVITLFIVIRTNEQRDEYFYSLWVEGTMIIEFLAVMLSKL